MGWQRSTLLLNFDPSTDFEGLTVHMRRMSVDEVVDVALLVDNRPRRGDGTGTEDLKAFFKNVRATVADALVSWDYEDVKGNPVPATEEGVGTCDVEMLMAILSAWLDVAVTVEAPKEPSFSGGPSQQAPPGIPMDVHLPNLESLPEPSST